MTRRRVKYRLVANGEIYHFHRRTADVVVLRTTATRGVFSILNPLELFDSRVWQIDTSEASPPWTPYKVKCAGQCGGKVEIDWKQRVTLYCPQCAHLRPRLELSAPSAPKPVEKHKFNAKGQGMLF